MSDFSRRMHGLESFLQSGRQVTLAEPGVQAHVLDSVIQVNLRGDGEDARFLRVLRPPWARRCRSRPTR